MGFERTAIWLPTWAIAAASLAGCSSQVTVEGDACVERTATNVALRVAGPGTFVDGVLHLDAFVDGRRAYVILGIEEGATILAEPAIAGSAALVPLGDSLHARIANGDGVELELVDTSAPLAPTIAATHVFPGQMPPLFAGVLGVGDGHLFFCHSPPDEPYPTLVGVDMGNPFQPGPPRSIVGYACHDDLFEHAISTGGLWVSWKPGSQGGEDAVAEIGSFELVPNGQGPGFDWAYAPEGAHMYGEARTAATDGTRTVLDPADDDWYLVFEEHGAPESGPYTPFPLAGPKRLVAVDGQVAFFATPDGIHAIDLSDTSAPALLDWHAAGDTQPADTKLVAVDARHLVVTDAAGFLYVADRSHSGALVPLFAPLAAPPVCGS